MKNILLTVFVLLSMGQLYSQCTEIFISEYVEGNQSNKAIELYNPTDNPINLSAYQLHRWNNGSDIRDTIYTLKLSGTIPAKGTWVMVKDTNATEIVYNYLRSKANIFVTPSCGITSGNRTMCHNGNDAYTLEKVAGNVVVDIFGQIGINPGEPSIGGGWNSNPTTNYTASDSSGSAWTTDNTLVRRPGVLKGVTVNPGGGGSVNAFDVSQEWDTTGFNNFDSLGNHNCFCRNTSISKPEAIYTFTVYPNPCTAYINIQSEEPIARIMISGINGSVTYNNELDENTTSMRIDIKQNKLPNGEYLLSVFSKNGKSQTRRIGIIN